MALYVAHFEDDFRRSVGQKGTFLATRWVVTRMKATLIAVGTRVPTWIQDGYAEFNRRLSPELRLNLIEIDSPKNAKYKTADARKEEEAALIVKHIKPGTCVVALDEKGSRLTSLQFANKITALSLDFSMIYFVIGGADGLAASFTSKANITLSFSNFTFPHMLVRVMLAEQWYRANMLLAGHPYHRE